MKRADGNGRDFLSGDGLLICKSSQGPLSRMIRIKDHFYPSKTELMTPPGTFRYQSRRLTTRVWTQPFAPRIMGWILAHEGEA